MTTSTDKRNLYKSCRVRDDYPGFTAGKFFAIDRAVECGSTWLFEVTNSSLNIRGLLMRECDLQDFCL